MNTVTKSVWLFLLLLLISLPANNSLAGSGEKQVWALSIDNDLFTPGNRDADFTGGMALTYSGRTGKKYWKHFDNVLATIDRPVGIGKKSVITPSIEVGLYGFTPKIIDSGEIQEDDRPYASLAYLSASRIYQTQPGGDAWFSSLTLGVIGLDWFGDLQNGIHRAVNNEQAKGWHNQVSDGGEPTFRYQLAYLDYWQSGSQSTSKQIKTTYFASLGYITEIGVALSTRRGLISSPSNRFNPELISYGERVNDIVAVPAGGRENYFWGGVALKGRVYNAFLQGQFKHGAHTLDQDDIRPLLLEAWAGYTLSIGSDFKLSYVIRGQSSEIRRGEGDRNLLWGGLVLSQTI